MGGSKSNTGIDIIDDTVDTVVNDVTNPAIKNIETSAQNAAKGAGAIASGKWDNLGRSLYDIAALGTPMMLANQDDVADVLGETVEQRMVRQATEQAEQEAVQEANDKETKRLDDINTVLTASAKARMNSPGKSALLVSGGGSMMSGSSALVSSAKGGR